MSTRDFASKDHLNLLLESAENMIAHNELDAAEALLHVIIKRDSQYTPARAVLDSLKSIYSHKYYVDYDDHTGMFEVLDENDERVNIFESRAEAENFARSMA